MTLRIHSVVNTTLLRYWYALILVVEWIFIMKFITPKRVFTMSSGNVSMVRLIAKEFRRSFRFRRGWRWIILFLCWSRWSVIISVVWTVFLQAFYCWIRTFAWWCRCWYLLLLLHRWLVRVMVIFLMGI